MSAVSAASIGWRQKSSSYPALVVIDWLFPQVATLRTRPQRAASGLDAVLLENPPEAEEFAVRGGEPLFEVVHGGVPGGAFFPQSGGEGVHDVALRLGRARLVSPGGSLGGLLGAQALDPLAQSGGGVEEVEADPSGAGDGPEVDLLLVLDELADRGLGAAGGGLAFCAGGAAQRLVAPPGRASRAAISRRMLRTSASRCSSQTLRSLIGSP